jgi:prepilin-type processing-associated H-X9-DG protein
MLVVISILAILFAILAPVVVRAREHGRITQCASNLKQLHDASMAYMMDQPRDRGMFLLPYAYSSRARDNNHNWYQDHVGWVNWFAWYPPENRDLATYWRGPNAVTCLTNGALWSYMGSSPAGLSYANFAYVAKAKVYTCPTFMMLYSTNSIDEYRVWRSYWMNEMVSGKSSTDLGGASRMVMFADGSVGARENGMNLSQRGLCDEGPAAGNVRARHSPGWDGCLDASTTNAAGLPPEHIGAYHLGKGNAVFVDGHVERLNPGDTVATCTANWGDQ